MNARVFSNDLALPATISTLPSARPSDGAGDIESHIQTVTPQYARYLRDSAHFERQRNISETNVERLAREMAAGRFTPGTQVYLAVLPDGTERVLNGNHTLEAVAESGVPQVLTITRKKVRDLDEAGAIYAVFDIQKIRSWRDSLRAVGAGDDIPLASQVLSAIGVIEQKFGFLSIRDASRLVRISKLEDYKAAASVIADAIYGGQSDAVKFVKRAAIFAVALETARSQPSAASEFWGRVAHDNGLKKGNPEKALLSWLRNSSSTGSNEATRREHAKAAASAWNAFFRQKSLDHVKPNQILRFTLLGTTWADGIDGDQ